MSLRRAPAMPPSLRECIGQMSGDEQALLVSGLQSGQLFVLRHVMLD